MKKVVYLTMLIACAIVLWGCSEAPKMEPRAIEVIKSDILTKTDDVNSYLSAHDLVNTKPAVMAKQLMTYSEEYKALVMEVTKMQKIKPDPALDELLALANGGETNTQNLSKALGDDPNTNPAAFAALKAATAAWADYTDKSILMATGKPPATTTAPPSTATAGASDQPGKGHHYGWWKNPAWANDPASRSNTNLPPGQVTDDKTKKKGQVGDIQQEQLKKKDQTGSDKPKDKGKPEKAQKDDAGAGKGNKGMGAN